MKRLGPRAAFAVLASVTALACAAAPQYGRPGAPSGVTSEDAQRLESAERDLAPAVRELDAAAVGPAQDCPRACTLAGTICQLAERICAIAGRYPADDPVAARCPDARTRCQRARAKTAACACAPGG
jgi:hypothetical protein